MLTENSIRKRKRLSLDGSGGPVNVPDPAFWKYIQPQFRNSNVLTRRNTTATIKSAGKALLS
jgi:hypothetical protein